MIVRALSIWVFVVSTVYAEAHVFMTIEKETSVGGVHKGVMLSIDVENKNDSPICILESDLPRAGYKPHYLDLIGDIDLITLSDEGMDNFTDINIHHIYANKTFYYSIDLEEAYGQITGAIDVNYSLPIYDCSILSEINSVSELLKADKKIIRAEKR